MRAVLHSDMNNFYASVECSLRPELKSVPVAVCGDPDARHGIVLAKNMPAKLLGVRTGEAIWEARQKCPGLVTLPPNFSLYLKYAREMRSIYQEYTPYIEPFGLDEAWLDVTENRMSPRDIADELRERAKLELGLTLSVGASFNKIFAKLGSDMKKPDATTVITQEDYREKIWPLPASDLLYVGPATARKLARRNILTIGDVARTDVNVLRQALGKCGEMIWCFANGLDQSPVRLFADEAPMKSIGNSTTCPRDLTCDSEVHLVVGVVAESVSERLRDAGMRGRVVSLSVRDRDLLSFSCQKKLHSATALASEIIGCAMALFREKYRWEKPVRSLGVAVSDLEAESGSGQIEMFPDEALKRKYELEDAVTALRGRFGHFSIQRASMLSDRSLTSLNPVEDHEIHPEGWRPDQNTRAPNVP